jgi:hypothetical protein
VAIVEIVVKYPFVIGFYFSNLSPIIPDSKLDANPKNVKEIAYTKANSTLNPGYVVIKYAGPKLPIIESEKCLSIPPAVINLVVGFE